MRIRKVSQPTPIIPDTAQITDTYSTSTGDGYSCNYINNKFEPVVLYNNAGGSRDTITLSESVNNFEYIEVFYGKGVQEAQGGLTSAKIPRSSTAYASLIAFAPLQSTPQLLTKEIKIAGTTISHIKGHYINFTASGVSSGSTNEIYIYRVLGWK